MLRRIPRPLLLWQGAICKVYASQLGDHWSHSQGVEFGIFLDPLY